MNSSLEYYKEVMKKLGTFEISIDFSVIDNANPRQYIEQYIDEWLKKNNINNEQIRSKLIERCLEITEESLSRNYGQLKGSEDITIVSDLKSPIVIGSKVKYLILSENKIIRCMWQIIDADTKKCIFRKEERSNHFEYLVEYAGNYLIDAEVYFANNEKPIKDIYLKQTFIEESIELQHGIADAKNYGRYYDVDRYISTIRELVNDFQKFTIEAAKATGPYGISARMLASILYFEIYNTPKSKRNLEIEYVNYIFSVLGMAGWVVNKFIDKSVGVGQIRLSTAAMSADLLPIKEQSKDNIDEQRKKITAEFNELDFKTKQYLLTQLEWPKSNITYAAQYLAKLKNRTNRYPDLDRKRFSCSEGPVSIIATEYNKGPTTTDFKNANISEYGHGVWNMMENNEIIKNYFPND